MQLQNIFRRWSANKSLEHARSLVTFAWLLTEEQEKQVQEGVSKLLSSRVEAPAAKRPHPARKASSSSKKKKSRKDEPVMEESADRFFA